MLLFILSLLILGLIAGAVARLLVPGPDPIGIAGTIAVGIVGSFLGGFLADALFHNDATDSGLHPAGLIGSIIGAIIVLLVVRAFTHRRSGYGRRRLV